MARHMDWVVLVLSLLVILLAAGLFTNGVEWIGEGFGLSEGAVGSVLAAVGTALPETLLPLVAIISGHHAGEEIGIGAILGAPFMLTTLAMVVIGVTVLVAARGGRRPTDLEFDRQVLRQDLGYFLVMYTLAMVAGILDIKLIDVALAIALLVGYAYYVRRHFQSEDKAEVDSESGGEIKPLYVWELARRLKRSLHPWAVDASTAAPFWQVAVSLALIVAGARLFISSVDTVADRFHVPPLAFTLLVAPVATELPEKFNSILWVRRRKDTLALGNMTGAMVFQSSFPVTIGLLFTEWKLAHESLVAACIALIAGGVIWLQLRFRGRLTGRLLLVQGVFYVGYVAYVATKF